MIELKLRKSLSESVSESVSRGARTRKYNGPTETEEQMVRKGLIDQLYLDVTDEIPMNKLGAQRLVKYLSLEAVAKDCIWCIDDDIAGQECTYYLAGKDGKVGSITFDVSGTAVRGQVYEFNHSASSGVTTLSIKRRSDALREAREYFKQWIYDTPW